jgi:hypothetical protein
MSGQETARLDNAGTLQNSVSTSLEIEKVAIVSRPFWREIKSREKGGMMTSAVKHGMRRMSKMFPLNNPLLLLN